MNIKRAHVRGIVGFLYEVGTLRGLPRQHRQALFTRDDTDNIASHSFRVAMIGMHLAILEGADVAKVVTMCLFHDVPEARSGDHNWIHKRYVKIFTEEVVGDQMDAHPLAAYIRPIVEEYEKRRSKEARIAKDADYLDQNMLLREYELAGNREAIDWIRIKRQHTKKRLYSDFAQVLNAEILRQSPSEWWKKLWTSVNR